MYSVVLMMAMTTGAETPELGRKGCNGCNGYSGYSCSGYSCGGGGCHGGGLFGGLFGGKGCNGCNGGGLFGGKHGCSGSSCHGGGYSCHGGGYSCHGGGYSCHGGYSTGCTGGHGYTGCTGGVIYGATGCVGGTIIQGEAKPMLQEKPKDMPKPEEISAPATLVVTLPSNAKLSIDDTVTSPKAVTTRVFETPVLQGGREFSYTLKAEFVVEGKPVVVTKKVAIRAGAEINVTLGANDVAAR
jgi:uncharacterized protein (TIGR03000 family)